MLSRAPEHENDTSLPQSAGLHVRIRQAGHVPHFCLCVRNVLSGNFRYNQRDRVVRPCLGVWTPPQTCFDRDIFSCTSCS